MKIGKFDITKEDVHTFVRTILAIVGVMVAWTFGRYSMAHEIDTILNYCNNPLVVADKEAGTITVLPDNDFIPAAAVNGSCLYEEDCDTLYPIIPDIAGRK